MKSPKTLAELVIFHLENNASKIAFRQLGMNGTVLDSVTFAELAARVYSYAAMIEDKVEPEARVLVAVAHGIDYVACILAVGVLGGVALPFMPLSARGKEKLRAIISVGRPSVVLHQDSLRHSEWQELAFDANIINIALPKSVPLVVDRNDFEKIKAFPLESDLALIQFTSGSTSSPKAVCLTHAAIISNESALAQASGTSETSNVLCWMPMHHDMGLIGNVIQSLYVGATHTILSPMHVMQRPERWLKEISALNFDVRTGGPNFIYELCCRKIPHEVIENLDLSGWALAYNGAEMIRRETLDAFVRKFERAGFSTKTFFPCYGMAENAVFVAGVRDGIAPDLTLRDLPTGSATRVACGLIRESADIRIVDELSGEELSEGVEGEIWVNSPGLALGYLTERGVDPSAFSNRLPRSEKLFYRTGDRGIIEKNVLYVCGRRSDVIKVRGITNYSTDIEARIANELGLVISSVAVISVDSGDVEMNVVVVESESEWIGCANASEEVKQIALKNFDISIDNVVTVRKGTLARTSSGKLMRRRIAELYVEGALKLHRTIDAHKELSEFESQEDN